MSRAVPAERRLAQVEQIANAVLYEGYLLYPYRPSSVKNRQRWTFGGVYPRAYSLVQAGSDAWSMQTQVLALARTGARLSVKIRFLHLMARQVGELAQPLPELPATSEPAFRPVERLELGGQTFHTWQEAVEREIDAGELDLDELLSRPRRLDFAFPPRRDLEPLRDAAGRVVGVIERQQKLIEGVVELAAESVGAGLARVTVRILNLTPFEPAERTSRDEALLQSFISTHTILGLRGGELVSLLEPPEQYRELAAGCSNEGTWPVLVGEDGQRDSMLSSPIILYDYPEIAPESPGDLFDGTEIDEILTLRILAMTDEEKREMQQVDERGRELLARTEALSTDQLMLLHGTMRSVRPNQGGRP